MLHYHRKLPVWGAMLLLAFLLRACAVQGTSLPRHHRFRGGEGEEPAAAYPPNADMIKALEYIENLKQRKGARLEQPTDYDEVEKFRMLLQLGSLQDEGVGGGEAHPPPPPPPPASSSAAAQRQDVSAEQLVKALLKSLQDQAGVRDAKSPSLPGAAAAAAAAARSDRRAHTRHRSKETSADAASAPAAGDYGNYPRPHKKYPLMFEDEENRDAYKRATEDLEEQYTPQSLANLRSIFDELGRMPSGQKRDVFGDDDEGEDSFSLRNLAYEDVAGGEDWVPVEEREETEELVNGNHEEYDRSLQESSDQDDVERDEVQRRAGQGQDEGDDDTKLVDYYLLKVLEMSDQTQKRDAAGEQKKRLIRPSLVDPRTVKELLELSLKLHVPPQDLIDMLITEELRKLHRHPQASPQFRTSQTPKIRYFSRRLPVKSKSPPEDMDREDFLDIIGVETISNEYPVMQRTVKPASSPDRVQVQSASAAKAPVPAKPPSPSGRRENLFLSELNKMPLKRQAAVGDDDDVEDEVTTYLAAKILTEYPNTISKRDTRAQLNGQFPYELYEQAMKDYLDQVDSDKGMMVKRENEAAAEDSIKPTETQIKDEIVAKTSAPQTVNEDEEIRGNPIGGM